MDISRFLSKVCGIYFIIVSTSMLMNMSQFLTQVNNLLNDAALMFVTGFFTLILGILMVVSHNIWQWNWRVIITILAWLTLLKGSSILFCPQYITLVSRSFVENIQYASAAAGIDLFLGVLLTYFGFKKS